MFENIAVKNAKFLDLYHVFVYKWPNVYVEYHKNTRTMANNQYYKS